MAIANLTPWGLLPVAPDHYLEALKVPIKPFIGTRVDTIEFMAQKLREPSTANLKAHAKGWEGVDEQIMWLNRIGDIATEFFCGSSNYCGFYYNTMTTIFDTAGLPIESIRHELAAHVAWSILYPESPPYPEIDEKVAGGARDTFLDTMRLHLYNGDSAIRVEGNCSWAMKIYATYLWGWLGNGERNDVNLTGKCHRRIFLE